MGKRNSLLASQFIDVFPRETHGLGTGECGGLSAEEGSYLFAHRHEEFARGFYTRLVDGLEQGGPIPPRSVLIHGVFYFFFPGRWR
jgi:hypothetical protein